VQVQFVRTWQEKDVTDDLAAALRVVEVLDPHDDLRLAVFNIAAQLITQRIQVQADQRGIVPQMAVSLPRKAG
jgi:hypothetical protein